jgi:hypothetical protein
LAEPGPNQPYYSMFRRGANTNLGRIYEAKKNPSQALAYYTQRDPTTQYVGNLIRARDLVWDDPMGAAAAPLPPAPTPNETPTPGKPMAAAPVAASAPQPSASTTNPTPRKPMAGAQ